MKASQLHIQNDVYSVLMRVCDGICRCRLHGHCVCAPVESFKTLTHSVKV